MKSRKRTVLSAEIINPDSVTKTPQNGRNLAVGDIQIVNVELPDFASKVIESERAVDPEGEDEDYKRLEEMGVFSPVHGMVNIKNVLDDALFARLYRNELQRQFIEFCQQYKDGRYSPVMQLPQAGMMMAARYRFLSKGIEEPTIKNRVAQFLLSVCEEYYAKFSGEIEEALDVTDVLNVLYAAMPHLPVYKEPPKEMDAKELYRLIELYTPNLEAWKVLEHDSYHILDETGINKLANQIGMGKLEMLKLLKKYGFLYLTKSSRGYQTNARFTNTDKTTYTNWVYCIFKFQYLAGIAEKKKKEEITTAS